MNVAILILIAAFQQKPLEAAQKKYSAGDFAGAVASYTEVAGDRDKALAATALKGRGIAWFRLGEFEKAEEDFSAAQGKSPAAELLAWRGLSRLRAKGPMAAAPDFAEALTLDSKCALAIAGQATVALADRQVPEAEQSIGRALELSPDLPEALYLRSILNSARGDGDSARDDLDRAITKDPFHIEARSDRIAMLVAAKEYDEALRDLDELVRLRPRSDPAYAFRASVKIQAKLLDDAAADLARAIELNPKSVEHLMLRATFHRRHRKDNAKSIADYTRVLELRPGHKEALTGRGYAHARMKNFQDSGRDLARAFEVDAEDPWGAYNLACFHGLRAEELKGEARGKAVGDAFFWLKEARLAGYLRVPCGCHGSTLEHLRSDSDLNALHDDRRWKAMSQPDENE